VAPTTIAEATLRDGSVAAICWDVEIG
jgi:hypothetical protein